MLPKSLPLAALPSAVLALLLVAAPCLATSTAAKKHCRDTVKTLAKCPDVGCPPDHHPNLNRAKNRTDTASSPTQMTVAEIVALQVDPGWGEDEPATSMQAAGEGKAVVAWSGQQRNRTSIRPPLAGNRSSSR